MKEFYNVSKGEISTKVLVSRSLQHIWSERILTISAGGAKRLEKLGDNLDGWTIAPPTPYRPNAIFHVGK